MREGVPQFGGAGEKARGIKVSVAGRDGKCERMRDRGNSSTPVEDFRRRDKRVKL